MQRLHNPPPPASLSLQANRLSQETQTHFLQPGDPQEGVTMSQQLAIRSDCSKPGCLLPFPEKGRGEEVSAQLGKQMTSESRSRKIQDIPSSDSNVSSAPVALVSGHAPAP